MDFTGSHMDGDLLVVSEFSNGGLVSTINVYRWNGDDATGSLNTTPIASGVDCRDLDPADPDDVCAAANTASITTPWDTAAKTTIGKTLPTAQFFEGGLDLTAVGLGDTCINTFIADTRSSTSLTATLFDFARGQLGKCETTVTSEQNWLPNDDASVTITGLATWGGSLKFTLFNSLNCTGTKLYDPAAITISQATTQPVSTNNTTVKVTATADRSWEVDFTPNQASLDAGLEDPDPVCESTALTINNAATHG